MDYNGFSILGDGTYGYKKVRTIEGNNPPSVLSGIYTTVPEAKKGIDRYVSEQKVIDDNKPPVLKTKPVSEKKLAELAVTKAEKEVKRNGTEKGPDRGKQL